MFQPEIKPAAIVRHKKFGVGKVLARYGEDELSKVIIKFQEEGEKKLSLEAANLKLDKPEPKPEDEVENAEGGDEEE